MVPSTRAGRVARLRVQGEGDRALQFDLRLAAAVGQSFLAKANPRVDAIGAADNARNARVIGLRGELQLAGVFLINDDQGTFGDILLL